MNFPILYERISEPGFPDGFYYAHLPTFGLTTHGKGIEGAKSAALDLISVWVEDEIIEKKAEDFIYSFVEV